MAAVCKFWSTNGMESNWMLYAFQNMTVEKPKMTNLNLNPLKFSGNYMSQLS
jgi:CRISPR/Cas system-associated endonuclease Cas3-HD